MGLCERRACLPRERAGRRERGGERGRRRGGFSLSLFLSSLRARAAPPFPARTVWNTRTPRTLTCLVRAMASGRERGAARRGEEEKEGVCEEEEGVERKREGGSLLFFSLFVSVVVGVGGPPPREWDPFSERREDA